MQQVILFMGFLVTSMVQYFQREIYLLNVSLLKIIHLLFDFKFAMILNFPSMNYRHCNCVNHPSVVSKSVICTNNKPTTCAAKRKRNKKRCARAIQNQFYDLSHFMRPFKYNRRMIIRLLSPIHPLTREMNSSIR